MSENDAAEQARAEASLRERVLRRVGPRPFVEHLGCELESVEPGMARVRMPWRPEHCRSGVSEGQEASLHGGAVASVADVAASSALVTLLEEGEGRTTIDLSVHYLAPLRGEVVAEARVRRRGGRTAVIDVEISDGAGLGALARATFAILPPRRG